MVDQSIINIEALRRLVRAMDGDLEDMRDLFESFVEDTPPLFASMRIAVSTQDWPTFRRAAHTAKGAARDFGALSMADICAGLERDATGGSVSDFARRIDELVHAFSLATAEIKKLLDSEQIT